MRTPFRSRASTSAGEPGRAPCEYQPADLRVYAFALLARWRLVVAGPVVALALGIGYLVVARKLYAAEFVLQVDDRVTQLDPGPRRVASWDPQAPSPAEREIELLRSRTLIGRVVDDLHLADVRRVHSIPLLDRLLPAGPAGRDAAIDQLRERLELSEVGKRSVLVRARLVDHDPERAAAVLDALVAAYLEQSLRRREAELQGRLAVIDAELPELRSAVEGVERSLVELHRQQGTVDPRQEAESAAAALAGVERTWRELELRLIDVARRDAPGHPAEAAARAQVAQLDAERRGLDETVRRMPAEALEVERRRQSAEAMARLQTSRLEEREQLSIAQRGILPGAHLVEAPQVSPRPVAPQRRPVIIVALLGGLACGAAAAVILGSLGPDLDDPVDLEREVGLPVRAVIPYSPRLEGAGRRRGRRGPTRRLAAPGPGESALEALRGLAASLQFAAEGGGRRVVALVGPAPEAGKSFVAENLARLLACGGRRVVLVDADLRRGRLHRAFGLDPSPGLAEVIQGTASLAEAVRPVGDGLDLVPRGRAPANPSDLLASARFADVIRRLGELHDLTVLDTVPLLAATDGALVARLAATTLVVVRAGRFTGRELSTALARIVRAGALPHGVVLNGVPRKGRAGPLPQ